MITEQNCEDYFLLYIDNELSADDRKTVDLFVSANPQSASLFRALQEAKLPVDNSIAFLHKERLYKDETADIGMSNYEEYFLLYTDDELSEEQKQWTERFVLQHPQVQDEFMMLQQTRLQPDVIEFKNKAVLYKKEKKAILFYTSVIVAAALVFGLLLFAGILFPHQKKEALAAVTSVKSTHRPASLSTVNNGLPNDEKHAQIQTSTQKNSVVKSNGSTRKTALLFTVNNQQKTIPVTVILTPQQSGEVAIADIPQKAMNIKPADVVGKALVQQTAVLKLLEEINNEQPNSNNVAMSLSDNNMAQPIAYKEVATDDNNQALFVSGIPLNKNKVNGFLKSASRLLGNKSKQTEN